MNRCREPQRANRRPGISVPLQRVLGFESGFRRLTLECLEDRRLLATFLAAVFDDAVDVLPGDGLAADSAGRTTLRAAIMEANALPGVDNIILQAGTYHLSIAGAEEDNGATGDLDVKSDVAIFGDAASVTVIDGGQLDRVFHLHPGAIVSLYDITISGGRLSQLTVNPHGGGVLTAGYQVLLDHVTITGNSVVTPNNQLGGGLYNSGTLTIRDSVISANSANAGGGIENVAGSTLDILRTTITGNTANSQGGGIYNNNTGWLNITDSVVSNNTTTSGSFGGGGIYNYAGAVTVTRSTFADNHANGQGRGGAILNGSTLIVDSSTFSANTAAGDGGALENGGTATIANSTFSGNTSAGYGGAINAASGTTITHSTITANAAEFGGGGICVGNPRYGGGPPPTIKNTIVGGNNATVGGLDVQLAFNSQGYNLIGAGDGSTGFTNGVNGDLVGTAASPINPRLGPLRNNGGPTLTRALLIGSPAIDAGNNTGAPSADQRGFARIRDGNGDATPTVDIGAYEHRPQPGACGVYDPVESKFYLKFANSEGVADQTFGFGAPNWQPLAGDWDGDGRDTIGLFQPAAAHFYLRNSNSSGLADVNFGYGDPTQNTQYVLVMGDWNGDGVDTIGLYHKASSTWFLRNSNTEGMADLTFGFGSAGAGWTPVVGDWDSDGIDTIGLYDPSTGMFYLRNSHTTGMADIAFPYGSIGSGWTPLIGDWDGDGAESAGFYQPGAASHFYLRNQFTAGLADVVWALPASSRSWATGWAPPACHSWRPPLQRQRRSARPASRKVIFSRSWPKPWPAGRQRVHRQRPFRRCSGSR